MASNANRTDHPALVEIDGNRKLRAASTPEKEELRRRFEQGGLRAFLAARDGQFRDE